MTSLDGNGTQERLTERRHIELFSFVAGINDVYLVATAIALVAVPLSLGIRKQPSYFRKTWTP